LSISVLGAAKPFSHDEHVGHDAEMLDGKEPAGTAKSRLHLIGN
jgi:hypothetical protein